ncbi:hypothetical protein Lalb_Chr05g0213851 [Lupinus albus]|uniref:Uncharacterized protein n=1 Tax=Lupinus albus TaxID=3870 RepID=A0A6A4QG32_LUPAL|nr:hypothetical protein Lalb_Chr05g0213851 [Lupinus albus]
MAALYVLLVLLMFCNSTFLGLANGLFNFTSSASPYNITSNDKPEIEDKRGVPSGANPLHNR